MPGERNRPVLLGMPGERNRPVLLGMPAGRNVRIVLGITALLFVAGTFRAVQIAWICDDAFVSLRYAENLIAGQGLVYNAGERVEGYTNFLWTLALAGAIWLGASGVAVAKAFGIACYVALAGLLIAACWRRNRREGAAFLPVAAGVVLVSPDFHDWASGGLETSLFALLALSGALLARRATRDRRSALAAGVVFSLLVLTRPDGLLFAAVGALGVLAKRETSRDDEDQVPAPYTRAQAVMLLAIPVSVTLLCWSAFKLSYYGELLPTAFYSKSVLRPYYGQGLVYLGLYLEKNWFLPAAILALVAWRWRSGARLAARDADSLTLAGAALLFLLYVVHVGGDFMFARRILPAVPLLLLALEEQLLRIVPERAQLAAAAVCVAAAAIPYPLFDDAHPRVRGIADERRFYPASAIEKRRLQGEVVGAALANTGARVMFEGGMCVFGYYSQLPYLAEMSGLTQYSLAQLHLEERGLIGHEKQATHAWLTENDIHFIVSQRFPPLARTTTRNSTDLVYFGDTAVARIHRYDDALMQHLSEVSGVSFVPIERVLDRARRELDRTSPERSEEILTWLNRYYLEGAGERGRLEAERLRAVVDARKKRTSEH